MFLAFLSKVMFLAFLSKVGQSDGNAIFLPLKPANFISPSLEENITNIPKAEAQDETNNPYNGNSSQHIMFSCAYLIPFIFLVQQLSCNINLS